MLCGGESFWRRRLCNGYCLSASSESEEAAMKKIEAAQLKKL